MEYGVKTPNSREPETTPLLVPVERQPGVVHQTARCQLRRMFAAQDRVDNVRRQNRETEEARCIGRNDSLGFGNVLEGQAPIPEKLIPDCVGPDEKTHEASVSVAGSDPSLTMIRISLPVRLRRAGMDSVIIGRSASDWAFSFGSAFLVASSRCSRTLS